MKRLGLVYFASASIDHNDRCVRLLFIYSKGTEIRSTNRPNEELQVRIITSICIQYIRSILSTDMKMDYIDKKLGPLCIGQLSSTDLSLSETGSTYTREAGIQAMYI
jgi:hypothetical protein